MKDYERLTARVENKVIFAGDLLNTPNYEKAIIDRLAELEDKIESGKLVELPCIVKTNSGWYVLWIENFITTDVNSIQGNFCADKFITEEAADAKLQEMKNAD